MEIRGHGDSGLYGRAGWEFRVLTYSRVTANQEGGCITDDSDSRGSSGEGCTIAIEGQDCLEE